MGACGCHYDFDPSDVDEWYEYSLDNFKVLPPRRCRVRCKECGRFIEHGAEVFEFERFRHAKSEVEVKIHDDNPIPMASWYHCMECAGIFLSLVEHGYCVQPDDVYDVLADHWENTGFDPKKYAPSEAKKGDA